jgi:hypothetical protein
MRPVAAREIEALEAHADTLPGSLATVQHSIKCWAEGLVALESSDTPLRLIANESVLVPLKYGVHLGRVDGVHLNHQNGTTTPNTFKDMKVLTDTLKVTYESPVGNIIDFKFAHGDGKAGCDEIKMSQINEAPLRKDRKQVTGYLSWVDPTVLPEASIIYIVDGGIRIHKVEASDEARINHHTDLAQRWPKALQRALYRALDREIVDYTLFQRKAMFTKAIPVPIIRKEGRPRFKWQTEAENPIVQTLKKHKIKSERRKAKTEKPKVYIDENKLFYDTEHPNQNRRYVLDWVRFEQLMEEGKIGMEGSKIACAFHHDKNKPNLHLYEETGNFHCYACQKHGLIDFGPNYKPDKSKVNRPRIKVIYKNKKPVFSEIDQAKIDQQDKVLSQAVKIAIKDSQNRLVEDYLRNERKIDPDFARTFSLGYGQNLAFQLIASGISYEEALTSGLINISESPHPSSLASLLMRRLGLKEEDIKRPKWSKEMKQEVLGFPYDPWEHRLIAPLTLFGGKITSLSGRIVPPFKARRTYIKPTAKLNGVVQGGFHLAEAINSPAPNIPGFESFIDTITFKLLKGLHSDIWKDYEPAGIIGTGNRYVISEILFSGKRFLTALDNDETGIERSQSILETAKQVGTDPSQIGDLLPMMLSVYPTMAKYDDPNSWWAKEGHNTLMVPH